jgi:RNA polymerase sigma-70 factor (ECF subfamily)
LLGALKHFLANQWRRSKAQKRGGDLTIVSIERVGEEEALVEPADNKTPDLIFDRRWAEELLGRVNARLRREYEAAGWGTRFDALKVYLLNGHDPGAYDATADELRISVGAVKSAVYRLRQRFGQALREEIEETVSTPDDVEGEIRHLLTALAG